MTVLTSVARLLASAVLACAAAAASAEEPAKGTLDQLQQIVDALKQQQQTPSSKYTVGAGSLAIESWLLTSTAIDGTAERIKAAIPKEIVDEKILVVAATEAVDFGQVAMLDLEVQALSDRMKRACQCPRRLYSTRGLPIALIGAVAGLLKSETDLTAIEQTVDAKLLAGAVAQRLSKGYLPSAAVGAGDGGELIDHFNVLVNVADAAQDEADRLANLEKRTAAETDKLARLKAILGRYDSFYTRVITPNASGVVPLAAAARLQGLIADNPYVLRVNTEKAGGTLLKRTNLWTALGAESAFISGGLVSSYQLSSPNDGDIRAAGVVICRTTLTSLKRVQQGSWSSTAARIHPIAVCLP